VVQVRSMHKLAAGDGDAYLTRHVAAGDPGLDVCASLTSSNEQAGDPAARWFGGASLGSVYCPGRSTNLPGQYSQPRMGI